MNKPHSFFPLNLTYTSISNLASWLILPPRYVWLYRPKDVFVGSDNDNTFDYHNNHSIYSKLLVLLVIYHYYCCYYHGYYQNSSSASRRIWKILPCLAHWSVWSGPYVSVACSRTVTEIPKFPIHWFSNVSDTSPSLPHLIATANCWRKTPVCALWCLWLRKFRIHFLALSIARSQFRLDPVSSWLIMATTPSCHFIWVPCWELTYLLPRHFWVDDFSFSWGGIC